jgi:hypothetical protein
MTGHHAHGCRAAWRDYLDESMRNGLFLYAPGASSLRTTKEGGFGDDSVARRSRRQGRRARTRLRPAVGFAP